LDPGWRAVSKNGGGARPRDRRWVRRRRNDPTVADPPASLPRGPRRDRRPARPGRSRPLIDGQRFAIGSTYRSTTQRP
jgi:hypothetical protein